MKRKLRNISGHDLTIQINGRFSTVANGAQVEVSDDVYWQTGEEGEEALWEEVSKPNEKKGK